MSEWVDRVENHEIRNQLQTITNLLEQAREYAEKQPDTLEDYNRLVQIIAFVVNVLDNCDPFMVPTPTLKNLSSNSQNIIQEITNYINNNNRAHLVSANNHADQLIIHGKTLETNTHVYDIDSIREIVGNFRKSAGQYIRYLEEDYLKLKNQLEELRTKNQELSTDINAQKSRLDNAISQFQQQFSAATEKRSEQFIEAENKRDNQYKQTISNIENTLKETLKEAENNFKTYLDSNKSLVDTKLEEFKSYLEEITIKSISVIDKFKTDSTSQLEELNTNANILLKVIEEKKEDALNLVQIIGNIGVTGNFQKIANAEKETADKLRNLALLLMVIMVLIIGFTVFSNTTNGFDWKMSLFRLSAALVLAIPATYAATESSKHRNAEYRNRQAELELASIDPFLEKMPEATKNDLKAKLTEKFFGNSKLDEVSSKEVSSSSLFDLIKITIENLTKK